jgi:hypothetical protein
MRWDTFMRKLLFGVLLSFGSFTLYGNTEKTDTIKTDIFEIVYSETLEQPLWIRYKVISETFGISPSQITSIKQKKTYKWLWK